MIIIADIAMPQEHTIVSSVQINLFMKVTTAVMHACMCHRPVFQLKLDLTDCYPTHAVTHFCLSAVQCNIQLDLHVLWQTLVKYFDKSAILGFPYQLPCKCDASLGSNVIKLISLLSCISKLISGKKNYI